MYRLPCLPCLKAGEKTHTGVLKLAGDGDSVSGTEESGAWLRRGILPPPPLLQQPRGGHPQVCHSERKAVKPQSSSL